MRPTVRQTVAALAGLVVALLMLVPPAAATPAVPPTPTAAASPTPSPTETVDPCKFIPGDAHKYCERDHEQKEQKERCKNQPKPMRATCESNVGGSVDSPFTDSPLDPMSSLASGVAQCAAWIVDQLSSAVDATAEVDFTNSGFLKTYSIVFAASTFLVLLVWLWAAMKRAVRGAPLTTALGEAVGLLWLTVLASAFTPLVLYTVMSAVDGITQALAGGSGSANFFAAFSDALRADDTANGGGPFARIVLALVSILAAGVVWLELVVRAALLYVGAALGLVVYSGLVDRELWSRVRRWVGLMAAIIAVKPIIVIVLRLASAMSEDGKPKDGTAAIISGLAIIVIAIFASAMLFRMIPGMGDDIVAARRDSYDPASRQAAAIITKPVSGISQGINTHGARDSAARPTASTQSAASHASGGIAAHSTRPSSGPKSPAASPQVPDQHANRD